jgi:glycerophosphoryl diester phosphodiesterase
LIRGLTGGRERDSRPAMRHPTTATAGAARDHDRAKIALPRVIGHRGAAACAPENTLAGFRRARALDCRWVEFDVRLTADAQPVLLHDSRLERTTDGRGKLSTLSLAAVRRDDAGAWFGPSFAEERVPTLEEAVTLLAALGLGANLELKATRGREAETGAVVADTLTRLGPSALPELLISSFRPAALVAARARVPGVARGILFRAIPKNWRAVAERLGCATIHADHQRLRPALVNEIRGAGYPLLAYTVNDPGRANALFDWGVTSVFSDDPSLSIEPRRVAALVKD